MTGDFEKLTVAELRTELRQRKLSTLGRKSELVLRLIQHVGETEDDTSSDDGLADASPVEKDIVAADEPGDGERPSHLTPGMQCSRWVVCNSPD